MKAKYWIIAWLVALVLSIAYAVHGAERPAKASQLTAKVLPKPLALVRAVPLSEPEWVAVSRKRAAGEYVDITTGGQMPDNTPAVRIHPIGTNEPPILTNNFVFSWPPGTSTNGPITLMEGLDPDGPWVLLATNVWPTNVFWSTNSGPYYRGIRAQ